MEEERRHASPEGLRSEKDVFLSQNAVEMNSRLQKRRKSTGTLTFSMFDFHVHCVFTVNIFAT